MTNIEKPLRSVEKVKIDKNMDKGVDMNVTEIVKGRGEIEKVRVPGFLHHRPSTHVRKQVHEGVQANLIQFVCQKIK